MERVTKSQLPKILMLASFLLLLLLTPLISTTMRTSYLYFLLNLLIVALGAEAGVLTAISKPREVNAHAPAPVHAPVAATTMSMGNNEAKGDPVKKKSMEIKKAKDEKPRLAEAVAGMKRSKTRPSLFFIGGCEEEEEMKEEVAEEEMEEVVKREVNIERREMVICKKELYMKAEVFIGNFYKQLQMQREKSWQKLHHAALYSNKAF